MGNHPIEPQKRPDPQVAWMSTAAARWYALDVNDLFSLEDIDLGYQIGVVSSLLPKNSTIADIGCGTGALSIPLARQGFSVSGFDVSSAMMAQLSRRAGPNPVRTIVADVFELDESHGTFDAAVSRWVLGHFTNWDKIVQSVGKIIRPGGVFVFDMKNKEHLEFAAETRNYQHGGGVLNPDDIEPYTHKPYAHVVAASGSEIEGALNRGGFELEARYSLGLFSSNLLLVGNLSQNDLGKRTKRVRRILGLSRTGRRLVENVAHNITPYLPPRFALRSLVVARRR